MSDIFKVIQDFNHKAGFLGGEYNAYLEASFQIEEALEGFDTRKITEHLDTLYTTPKDISREILSCVKGDTISAVDALDKACDSIVFAVGSMLKLGLTADMVSEALHIVMKYNMAKLENVQVDPEGKLIKPEAFVGPEKELQELLDRGAEWNTL